MLRQLVLVGALLCQRCLQQLFILVALQAVGRAHQADSAARRKALQEHLLICLCLDEQIAQPRAGCAGLGGQCSSREALVFERLLGLHDTRPQGHQDLH